MGLGRDSVGIKRHSRGGLFAWPVTQVGMTKGVMLTWSRVILFQEFAVDRHYENIAVRVDEVICSIQVNKLYHERSFSFWLEFAICHVCHDHQSSDS